VDIVNWKLASSCNLSLEKSEIHIWRMKLDVTASELQGFSGHLSLEERARAERFLFPSDRDHFVAARGMLRKLLGMYLTMSPSSVLFEAGAQGKPFLAQKMDCDSLRFNLSHAHGMALFAFSTGRELGIDLEKIRPEVATEEIAERYFSRIEQQELRALPSERRAEAFFLCWTRKEAYVKAHGGGLQIPLDGFDVSLTPGQPARLHCPDQDRWKLTSFTPLEGFAAAVVAENWSGGLCFFEC
jgi:4'-phosphopantetheinyl transferase